MKSNLFMDQHAKVMYCIHLHRLIKRGNYLATILNIVFKQV